MFESNQGLLLRLGIICFIKTVFNTPKNKSLQHSQESSTEVAVNILDQSKKLRPNRQGTRLNNPVRQTRGVQQVPPRPPGHSLYHRRKPTAADYAPLIYLGMESNVMNRPGLSDDVPLSEIGTSGHDIICDKFQKVYDDVRGVPIFPQMNHTSPCPDDRPNQ
ncbi:hypothetical protein DPMN_159503 [Dreissena polymorpha]|uniref:Uncharacterized protein n=1 Tax=Dreissena polymorpha TaxID=45954 RepID=A0A9D4ELJ2_DREPO|nr:hypothetical protein DPMN_159503 [Dreissena polymorpha]